MNRRIQLKMEEYRKMANSHNDPIAPKSIAIRKDSLSQVIHSKKDADDFMADLESAFKRAKQQS
ncbi:hypothetical protein [Pedobacter sp.]|jgi:hypothetical protein|uniref:hypothetical protein n=1 Tax=Pedobacter sp. TaxID=1411316 RepID=UPI002B8D46C9|nr:hypothetical protein [Pedobacter sp.]HWW40801.1 hypothetical protein [Pedobacter sp.]